MEPLDPLCYTFNAKDRLSLSLSLCVSLESVGINTGSARVLAAIYKARAFPYSIGIPAQM